MALRCKARACGPSLEPGKNQDQIVLKTGRNDKNHAKDKDPVQH